MPKFFYSIFVVLSFSWGTFLYLLFNGSAGSYSSIFLFIFSFFIAFGFSLSIPIYLLAKKKKPEFINNNVTYRKSLKIALFVSFGIAGILLLRAFRIVTLLNGGLFLLLYVGIFYQLQSKR